MALWIASDWHFNHDREFIWKARGFSSIYEMNETIIKNHNAVVKSDDDVFVLGDLCLGDLTLGRKCINQLNGNLHIIIGNHDTDQRLSMYNELHNVVSISAAEKIKYNKYNIFMAHFPAFTGSLEHDSLKKTTIDFFGHTHSKDLFFNGIPFMYNCAMDAHECKPISIQDAIADMENEVVKCKSFL